MTSSLWSSFIGSDSPTVSVDCLETFKTLLAWFTTSFSFLRWSLVASERNSMDWDCSLPLMNWAPHLWTWGGTLPSSKRWQGDLSQKYFWWGICSCYFCSSSLAVWSSIQWPLTKPFDLCSCLPKITLSVFAWLASASLLWPDWIIFGFGKFWRKSPNWNQPYSLPNRKRQSLSHLWNMGQTKIGRLGRWIMSNVREKGF